MALQPKKKKSMGTVKETTPALQPIAQAEPGEPKKIDDWEHQNNADALMKAHEIMSDPEKMKGAMIHIKKKAKAIRSVKDIQAFHQAKYGPGGDPDMEVE